MMARDHIGQHFLVGVPDVRRRVCVIDRRGDEKRLWHSAITSVAAVRGCRKQRTCSPYFSLALAMVGPKLLNEQLSQGCAFGSSSRDLHGGFRGRQAELCEDGQKLPDER